MYLIIGLGNPGARYLSTRHNVGFMLADRLVSKRGGGRFKPSSSSLVAQIQSSDNTVLVAKPLTYMNRSGFAVEKLMKKYDVEQHHILVAYDDVSLPFGQIRIRSKGSSGGHKGMESIIQTLGSAELSRLRVGINSQGKRADLSDFVLADFEEKETADLIPVLDRSIEALDIFLTHGIKQAMSACNSS